MNMGTNSQGDHGCAHMQVHGSAVYNDTDMEVPFVEYDLSKVGDYGFRRMFPHEWVVDCHQNGYSTKKTLNYGLFTGLSKGHEQLVFDVPTNTEPGVVFKGVIEPTRVIHGRTENDVVVVICLEANTPGLSASSISVDIDIYGYKYNATKQRWGNAKHVAWTYYPTVHGLTSKMISATTSGKKFQTFTWDFLVDLPADERRQWINDHPTYLQELMDDLVEQIVPAYFSDWTDPTSYSTRGYIPDWADNLEGARFLSSSYLSELRETLLEIGTRTRPTYNDKLLFGDATVSAADSAKAFTGNTWVYAKELITIKESITGWIDLLTLHKPSSKEIASMYLSTRYGVRLTILDTIDLIEATFKAIRSDKRDILSCRGGSQVDGVTCHCKLYYRRDNSNDFLGFIEWLYTWDLFPSLENLWDIVPYSFVIDWFLDVGKLLNKLDSIAYTKSMDIVATCYSSKVEWKPDNLDRLLGLSGEITFTHYRRLIPLEPYQPIPSFSGVLPSAINIVDGTALILQKVGK